MYGYIEWTEDKSRIAVTEREILRLRFRCVSIPRQKGTPQFILRRRCGAAARLLHREGVTRAVFPDAFAWMEEFDRCDVRPVDLLSLYRTLAAELVQRRLDTCGQTGKGVTVAVCTRRLTEEVRRTVTELCIRNRYVMLFTPERDDVFCRRLRREYGIPLVQTEDPNQLAKAAVIVRFSPEAGYRPGQEVIDLFPGGVPFHERLRLPPETEEKLPADCERMQLMAALYGAGAIRAGQIQVVAPETAEKTASVGEKA